MVFEVTRHGARAGIRKDYFNTNWIKGELTNVGKRQHYLLGHQVAQKYQQKYKGFLDPNFNSNEIYVRATDYNRTIESAQAQIQGIYHPGNKNLEMDQNQSAQAIPLFKISRDIVEDYSSELAAVPYLQRFIPIHVYSPKSDFFQPPDACPYIQKERERREFGQDLKDLLRKNHLETIKKVAEGLNQTYDNAYDPMTAVWATDGIWARTFDQQITPGFEDQTLLNQMMDLLDEEFTNILATDDTQRQLFATGVLSELASQFLNQVKIDQDPVLKAQDRLKLFIYSDHDDSMTVLTKTFSYKMGYYPKYASQILFELIKKSDNKYYVSIIINDISINIPGVCNNQQDCELNIFIQLIKDVSYYGRENQYNELCGIQQKISNQEVKNSLINVEKKQLMQLIKHSEQNEFSLKVNLMMDESIIKILVAYSVILAITLLIFKFKFQTKVNESPIHKLNEENSNDLQTQQSPHYYNQQQVSTYQQ
eukprot:403376154